MTTSAMLLVLASAFLHAGWNALLKKERDSEVATAAVLAIATVAAIAVALATASRPFPETRGLVFSVASGLCEGGYFIALGQAFRASSLALVYTVARGGAIVAVWPISALWMGEALTPVALAGAAVVCAGLVSAGLDRARVAGRGLGWAVACALFIAGYHLFYKAALHAHAHAPSVFAVSLGLALPMNLAWLGRRGVGRVADRLRARPARIVVAGLACTASFLVFLGALAASGAGVVLTLRNTSVVFAQAMAFAIGERPTRRQLAGAALVALGALLLGLA